MTAMSDIRRLKSHEISHFHQKGWAYLPGLVNTDICAQLLDFAEGAHKQDKADKYLGIDRDFRAYNPRQDQERAPRQRIMMSTTMGRNVADLLEVPQARLEGDVFLLKSPSSDGTHERTLFHQDFPGHPFDRSGFLTIWIALHDMDATAGTMRFYEESHCMGVLGQVYADNVCLNERVARQRSKALSPPLSLKAGDATVHHSLTVHGAPSNTSSDPRWAYAIIYVDADARYSGNSLMLKSGADLKLFDKIDHPAYPLVPID